MEKERCNRCDSAPQLYGQLCGLSHRKEAPPNPNPNPNPNFKTYPKHFDLPRPR